MEIGIKHREEAFVTEENTALTMGSGTLRVFATPAMVALMENTAKNSIADQLEEGSTTVGTAMELKHVSATPVGMKVYCDSELVEVNGRAMTFALKVYDEAGLIGEGTHERFIVFADRFVEKAYGKLEK